jgi:uncharacterized protein YjbI with pentapeptide repeats
VAHKQTPSVPVSLVRGKHFWIDPQVRIKDVNSWIRKRGGVVVGSVDATLDYLVLGTDRRAAPGNSPAEKKAAKAGGSIVILYEEDLPALLLPTREEALAVLAGGAANDKVWDEILPPRDSPWQIDISGADLSGLELVDYGLRNCTFEDIRLEGANLHNSSVDHPKNVDFRKIKLPASMFIGEPDRCHFGGMVLGQICITDPIACDFSDADLTGQVVFRPWEAPDLIAERANFTGVRLTGAKLPGARLRGANFTSTTLCEAGLDGADLREANLTGANLRGASLRKADLCQANFRDANLGGADLTGAKITGTDFKGANLHQARGLPASILKKTQPGTALLRLEAALMDFPEWRLEFALTLAPSGRAEIQLTNRQKGLGQVLHQERMESHSSADNLVAALRRLAADDFPGATPLLDAVTLTPETTAEALGEIPVQALAEVWGQPLATAEEALAARQAAEDRTVQGRQDARAGLREGAEGVARWNALDELERKALGDLKKIDLSGCDLAGVYLRAVDCSGANFSNTNLTGANLVATHFRNGNLKGADLGKVNAHGVLMTGTNLEGASLRDGKFTYSGFVKANLRSADLTGVDFKRASFKGADLTGATLTSANFDRADYDAATIFPAGFNPQAAGMVLRTPKAKKKKAAPADPAFVAFVAKLPTVVLSSRIKMAVSMLKKEKFQLFAETADDRIIGVVRSQSSKERVYACRLTSSGQFECGTQNLRPCGGLQGKVCKHLLTLLLGLTKSCNTDGETLFSWLQLAQRQKATFDKEAMTATFLKYKGAEAGDVDWRPTETVPEDYYAL